MHGSPRIRTRVAEVILGFIGYIFVLKYGGRHGTVFQIVSVVYAIILIASLGSLERLRDAGKLHITRRSYLVYVTIVFALSVVAVYVLPEKSNVSRFPALVEWLKHFLSGEFPYGIPKHPSAFPMLFFISIPFYFLGNVGLLEAAGVGLFALALLGLGDRGKPAPWLGLLALFMIPTTYYELITRSELLFNMSLVLMMLTFVDRHYSPDKIDKRFFAAAILFGLVLSTRSVVGMVYLIYAMFKFRDGKIKAGLAFTLIVLTTFLSTLIPFVLWDPRVFFSAGPFDVQFGYVSPLVVAAALLACIISGLLAHDILDTLYYSGIVLFAIVLYTFVARSIDLGFDAVIFQNRFDVGYFIFSVPFLLAVIGIGNENAAV